MPILFLRRHGQPQPPLRLLLAAALVLLVAPLASTPVYAQWIKYPTAGVPRHPDGTVNMTAPAPRLADGKPDLSGVWTTADTNRRPAGALSTPKLVDVPTTAPADAPKPPDLPGDPSNIVSSRFMANIGAGLSGGLPYQPWQLPVVKARTASDAIDDPHIRCLPDHFIRAYGMPHMLKFVHTPSLLVMLNEMNASYRQVFADGRPLPKELNPTLQGYSTAKWEGDALVIDSAGFRNDTWIDWNGSVITETAKVREQIRRPDFGHLEITITVDDPKAYTKPWTVTLKQKIVVDADLIDEICLENEFDVKRLK